jgi:phosphate transport system permease protein
MTTLAARTTGERVAEWSVLICATVSILTTFGIVALLARESVLFFSEVNPLRLISETEWTPLFATPRFGIWPLLAGTLLVSAIALVVAVPVGVGAAIWLSEIASLRMRRILKPLLEVLAGVPTLVYGALALVVVTPILQNVVPNLAGFNALAPGLVMGLMLVATVATLVEDSLRAVPLAMREAAWGLGADRVATVLQVVLPSARSGIIAATTLALGRAVGETMIVAIAAGQQPRLTLDPRVPIETMTAFIVQVAQGDVPQDTLAYRTLFVVGALLFALTLALNMLARWAVRRHK